MNAAQAYAAAVDALQAARRARQDALRDRKGVVGQSCSCGWIFAATVGSVS